MDIVSPAVRSKMMGNIRGKGTKPEIAVRKAAYRLGYRYRLNKRDIPGTPDSVFLGRRVAIFVHGCFWHRHENCKYCYKPRSNIEFWEKKFNNNTVRDRHVRRELEQLGWHVEIIWECERSRVRSDRPHRN
jgi:DNA mismatch endonuclease (patch repair protein)